MVIIIKFYFLSLCFSQAEFVSTMLLMMNKYSLKSTWTIAKSSNTEAFLVVLSSEDNVTLKMLPHHRHLHGKSDHWATYFGNVNKCHHHHFLSWRDSGKRRVTLKTLIIKLKLKFLYNYRVDPTELLYTFFLPLSGT